MSQFRGIYNQSNLHELLTKYDSWLGFMDQMDLQTQSWLAWTMGIIIFPTKKVSKNNRPHIGEYQSSIKIRHACPSLSKNKLSSLIRKNIKERKAIILLSFKINPNLTLKVTMKL
jgi:hypothetical protein